MTFFQTFRVLSSGYERFFTQLEERLLKTQLSYWFCHSFITQSKAMSISLIYVFFW